MEKQSHVLKTLTILVFVLLGNIAFGQNFINGDFEINYAGTDQINIPNSSFNSYMPNCNAFGSYGNMDIISSNAYSGFAYSGSWYVALTGGGSDLLALELDMPLVIGNSYTISYHERSDPVYNAFPIEIGLSTSNSSFGTSIYTAPSPPQPAVWTQKTFTFVATNNGQFITVQQQGGYTGDWVHIDNFTFNCGVNLNLGNDLTFCQGQTITLNGGSATTHLWSNGSTDDSINVSTSGVYWVQASNGICSATDTITITQDLLPEIHLGNDTAFCNQLQYVITPTITAGTISNFVWQDNSSANSFIASNSGVYWLQASNSCGISRDTIHLLFYQPIIPSDSVFICPGASFTLSDGTIKNAPGTYPDTFNSLGYLGCDSIVQRVINWYPSTNDTLHVALCSGTSFTTSSGIVVSLPGYYSDTLMIQNQFGCDSIQVIEIMNVPSVNTLQNRVICFGQSIILPDGSAQNTAGTSIDTLTSVSGCDSIITTNLTISPAITASQTVQVCNAQNYILPSGIIVNTSGVYLDTIASASGCDSVITINLTLSPPLTSLQNIQICFGQNYILPSGITVNASGTYHDTLSSLSGCDSIITTNLNYYNDIVIPIIPEMGLCTNDSISFSLNGNFNQVVWSNGQIGNTITIFQSGNYQVNVSDVNGCVDSTTFSVIDLVLPSISIELSDSSICIGDCIKLSVLGTNSNEFSWSINNENIQVIDDLILYCFNDTGAYNIRVSSIEACGIAYDTLSVLLTEPEVFLPSDTLLQFGDSLNLWSQGNYSEFWWQPTHLLLCDSCESQNIDITENQRFFLYYTNSNGCIFNKSFLATINKEGQLYIPTSFTPNGDNINDEFCAKGRGIIEFNMMIYNRIGELIFESIDINKGWNGSYFLRNVQEDIYAYVIEYKDYNNVAKIERGFVMLVR